jgi:hypothetical protein
VGRITRFNIGAVFKAASDKALQSYDVRHPRAAAVAGRA